MMKSLSEHRTIRCVIDTGRMPCTDVIATHSSIALY